MRPVRPNGKLKLEQQLVGRRGQRVVGPAVLRPHLTELARPVRQDDRTAGVGERRVGGAIGPVDPDAGEPAASELVVAGDVEAARSLEAVKLIPTDPDPLGSADERVVERSLQRLPPDLRVEAVQLRLERAQPVSREELRRRFAGIVVPAGV